MQTTVPPPKQTISTTSMKHRVWGLGIGQWDSECDAAVLSDLIPDTFPDEF